jgi:circadian clock protein KaiC
MVAKAPTGIAGLDEITHGGLPAGRATLVCGGPGCGKTILAMEFLVRGALEFDEPGLFVSFDESVEDLHQNFRSFGFDLEQNTHKIGECVDTRELRHAIAFLARFPSAFMAQG